MMAVSYFVFRETSCSMEVLCGNGGMKGVGGGEKSRLSEMLTEGFECCGRGSRPIVSCAHITSVSQLDVW